MTSPGARSSGPAAHKHLAQETRLVGHDAVYFQVEQVAHHLLVVDGPDMNGQTRPVRGPQEAGRNDRDRSLAQWDLDAVGALTRHASCPGDDACHGNGTRTHRGAGPATAAHADLAKATVGERADAQAVPGVQPLDEVDQRRDAGIGLRIDVDALLRPADQQFLEAGDPNSAAAVRESAPSVWGIATWRPTRTSRSQRTSSASLEPP
jgi:hypothetical protein